MKLAPSGLLGGRLARLRTALAPADCDALVVSHLPNLFYLSNLSVSAGFAVVGPDTLTLVVDFRYLTAAEALLRSESGPPNASVVQAVPTCDEALAGLLASSGARRIGVEAERMTIGQNERLTGHLPAGARLVPTRGLVEGVRAVKDGHEIACLRRSARLISETAAEVLDAVRPGLEEREVAAAVEAAMRRIGFSRPAFDTIVGSGPNGALPHATAGERTLRPGDLIVLDFGGVCDGYCADLTRTVSLGPPGAEARRVHAAVLAAQAAAIGAVRPGVSTAGIDRAARAVLEAEGFGEAFGHATGHGLGLEVHEDPRIAPARRAPGAGPVLVQPGMVFTVEPGVYLPGWGGVRIEDDVLVTADGCEVLTTVARDLAER
jgi:Xaa-Pro aminopeptidase